MHQGHRTIFSPTLKNQPLTGRNANIQTSMFKRKQIFEKPVIPTQRYQTPFYGHSFTGSSVTSINESGTLAQSQVSEFNNDVIRRIVREQLQRNGGNNNIGTMSETSQESLKNKNDLNILKIQIRSVKESFHQMNKQIKRKFQENSEQTAQELKKKLNNIEKAQNLIHQEINHNVQNKLKQYESEITRNMRTLYQKIQQDFIKQYKEYTEGNYVPLDFLNSLDDQLSQIQDRISHVEVKAISKNKQSNNNVQNNSLQSSKSDKNNTTLTSAAELKLNKIEKDFEYLKKIVDEKSLKIKQLDEKIFTYNEQNSQTARQTDNKLNSLEIKLKQQLNMTQNIDAKVQSYKKKTFQKIQAQIENISKNFNQPVQTQDRNLSRVPDSTSILLESGHSQSKQEQNKKIQQKQNISNTVQGSVKSPTKQNGQSNKRKQYLEKLQQPTSKSNKKINVTSGSNTKINSVIENKLDPISDQLPQSTNQLSKSECSQIKKLYKIDKDGYLMDCQNKYILSPLKKMIKITEKQIDSMESSNFISVQKWGRASDIRK